MKDVIVCPHPERSLLRYDDSQNIVKSGENSYIFSMHVFASNCSAFGFEIPILGATKIYATLYDGSSYAISNIEMSTGLLYGMHPVIMDVTNYTLQGALNYTLQLTSESQCGNISESVTLQFEEKIKDLSLQVI